MSKITTIFWDVGGVILTDGWDKRVRRSAAERFGLDWDDLEERHDLISANFETGRLSLDDYLNRTVFCRPRSFNKDDFRTFMFEQSKADDQNIDLARRIFQGRKYLLATINNESTELNEYRISKFSLRECFSLFFSSCFLRVKKPHKEIYLIALQVTQRSPAECLYIDDRELNIESARQLGMQTILYRSHRQLLEELHRLEVKVNT